MRTNLNGEQPANSAGSDIMPDKFKSGEQLLKAYEMLEAAFTRKSQKLKELLEENARLKGELMEKQPDLSGIIEDFKAYPEGAQYAPGLSAVLQSEPNLTPAGLLAALARVIRCECVPREQLLQDREFVEKYVLTNEDITEYILRKYLGGLLRGETPRSISGAGGFMPACERRRASSIEEAGKMAAQSFSGRR